MTFTMEALSSSIAGHLAPELPGVTFYDNPAQQGVRLPALFLRRTNARITKRAGVRFLRRLGLDLVCVLDFHRTGMEDQYTRIADILDQMMETFPYRGGQDGPPALLRTYERRWNIVDDVLHYRFDLKIWVSKEEDTALMRSIESYTEEVS